MRNAVRGWRASEAWTRDLFTSPPLGEQAIHVDNAEIIATQGHGILTQTLRDYIDEFMPIEKDDISSLSAMLKDTANAAYSFTNFLPKEWPRMVKDAPPPKFFRRMTQRRRHYSQLAIGSTGSGLYWHNHEEVFNAVVKEETLDDYESSGRRSCPSARGLQQRHFVASIAAWKTIEAKKAAAREEFAEMCRARGRSSLLASKSGIMQRSI